MTDAAKKNGFTLLEMLIVLVIVSLGVLMSVSRTPDSLSLFMEQMQSKILQAQLEAMAERSSKKVEISASSMQAGSQSMIYPDKVACTPASFSFNARGNISSAGTVHCTSPANAMKIVYQLGSGRLRIEPE